uniref:ESPR-type extended signal peptide-containing protein n=1 Tax=uncultured Sutterella sp. TaxID=286133 RepID=UPI0026059A61
MNSNFKVVFNKARGALMVANEITSSVQAKGTKTVVAAAVAAVMAGVAGTAMAADVTSTLVNDKTENTATVLAKGYENLTINKETNFGGKNYGAVIVNGVSGASGAVLSVDGAKFNNNTAYTNVTDTAAAYGQGGALAVYNSKLQFNNAQISGNTAQGHGGAVVLQSSSEVTFHVSGHQDVVYAGNKAGSGYTKYEDMGGFAYVKDGSTLTLSADKGSSLTIGNAGAAETAGLDSIASYNNGTIKVGGDVTINGSTEWFTGTITAQSGSTLTLATGFGSRNTQVQVAANNQASGAAVSGATLASGSVLTVESGASVTINDVLEVTGTVGQSGAGTTVNVNANGKFVVDGIKVTTLAYADKDSGASGTAIGKGLTTAGYGVINVESTSGAATVRKDVVVDQTTKLDKTGAGVLKIEGTLSTAAETKDASGAVTKATGQFNLASGSVTTNNLANAGATNVAANAKLTVTGTEGANSGVITLGTANDQASGGSLVVAKGGSLVNTGSIAVAASGAGNVIVNGKLDNFVTKDVSGKAVNTYGKISGVTVTVADGGVLSTKIGADEYFAKKTIVSEGGTFNLTELNSQSTPNATTPVYDQTLIAGGTTLTLDGGAVTLNGEAYDNAKIQLGLMSKVGEQNVYTSGTLEVKSGTYTADQLVFRKNDQQGSQEKSNLTVGEGAAYTLNTLDARNGKVDVAGSLTVSKKLSAAADSSFTVEKTGVLTTTADAIGLTVTASGASLPTSGATFDSGSVVNNGKLVLSGLDATTTKAGVQQAKNAIQAIASTGLVDFGTLKISDALTSGGTVKFSDVTSSGALAGITNDQIKKATVEGVDGTFDKAGSFGNLLLSGATSTATVGSGAALTLNNGGDLVKFVPASGDATIKGMSLESDASLTTTGKDAKIGAVVKAQNATGTALSVASGNLEVAQTGLSGSNLLVDVAELNIADGAALSVGLTVAPKAASGNTPAVEAKYGDITTGTLTVEGTLAADKSTVTVQSGGTVNGVANIKTLALTGTLNVGAKEAAGSLSVGELQGSGYIFADPAWVNGVSEEHSVVAVGKLASGSTVEAGRNSIVAVGTSNTAEAEAAFKQSGFVLADTDEETAPWNAVSSVVYVNGGKTVSGSATTYTAVDGYVLATGADKGTAKTGEGVYVDDGALLIIDAATVDTEGNEKIFKTTNQNNVEINGTVYVANTVNGDKLNLTTTNLDTGDQFVFDGDILMSFRQMTDALDHGTGVYALAMDDEEIKTLGIDEFAGFDAAYAMFEQGLNHGKSSSAAFNNWLYSSMSHGEDITIPGLRKIANDVASLGATTGVQTLT